MPKNSSLVRNTALLTASALLMRIIGLAYQVWLAGRIGAAGIGLFQLVMSVSLLCTTFAISGIRFAATRLISEEIGFGHGRGIDPAMGRCFCYSLFFGCSAMIILLLCAEPVGFLWIRDARTVLPLRLLSLSLPFVSLSSVMAGYFTACGRVYKSAFVQVSEQLVRIALVAFFLYNAPAGDLELSCAAVVAGGSCAELFSFLLMLAVYLHDRRRHREAGGRTAHLTGRMFSIALPLALSAYARTSLSTAEHLLVPGGLRASGMSADAALAGYGVIQGMVFPIITFPSCLLLALAELLVPELTSAQVAGKAEQISHTVSRLLEKCLMFSLGAAAVLFTYSDCLGRAVYGSDQAGDYIRIFALLAPVIYMDMVTDGCLKGLGQHMRSMLYNICDAVISVVLVYFLLPRWALTGYICIICFTECFNFVLSIFRLKKITRLRINAGRVMLSLLCSVGAAQGVRLFFTLAGLSADTVPGLLSALVPGIGLYFLLMIACSHTAQRSDSGTKGAERTTAL